ncbi:MAG TPA: efflux RND transporter periplasmic adaptor subunit, partial [Desulfobacterales bacterium]|nr:efflux RND transporter periplasmic adaptor subunit [Desulfobacterales bacterium]
GGQSATVMVKVAFVERPEELVPGSLATVDIAVGLHADALSLPRGPFLSTGRGLAVYRIDGDMARRVDVGFGITTGTRVEVVKGLEAGERVIVSSYQDFLEFMEIHIDPAGGVAHDTVQ